MDLNQQYFPRKEAIKFGWETTKKNFKFFLILLLIIGAVDLLSSYSSNSVPKDAALISIIIGILSWAINSLLTIGQIKISLKFVDGNKAEWSELFKHYQMILKYMAGSLAYGLIVGLGFVLLIVPGIIWSIKLQYYGYYIVDQGLGPIEALKKSWELTKGRKWNLFVFGLMLGGINILGALALLVGLLWTIPTTMLAQAYMFRKLSATHRSSPPY